MNKHNRKQNKQYQVFILKNGEYLEITYDEFCRTQDTIFKDAFFISSNGVLMEVSQEFYKEYYYDKNHSKYLDRLESEHTISFHNLDDDEFCGEDILVDYSEDVVEQVTTKLMIEKLRQVLPLLSEEEQLLIHKHYFEDIPETKLAIEYGITQQGMSKRISKIREKLKKLMEN